MNPAQAQANVALAREANTILSGLRVFCSYKRNRWSFYRSVLNVNKPICIGYTNKANLVCSKARNFAKHGVVAR